MDQTVPYTKMHERKLRVEPQTLIKSEDNFTWVLLPRDVEEVLGEDILRILEMGMVFI
jgi:hypothetical protein